MSDFPILKTGAVLQYPATRAIQHSTCVLRFLDGSEQRFREYPSAIRKWAVRLDLLDECEMGRLEDFFQTQQGRLGSFSFTDPWDGTVYPSCSLEDDSIALEFEGLMRGRTTLTVRENRG
jgi:hypothetical protein